MVNKIEGISVEDFLSQLDPSLRKRLSNATDVEVTKQKTPSISLNNALKGGFAYGRQVMVWGNKSAGKSSFCLQMIGEAQKEGKLCAWIDAGCKIDEIATTVNYDATSDKNNYMNTEIYNVVVPHVEQLQQKFDFKFRIVDISQITLDLFKKWDTNFEYNVNFHFSPNYPARSLLREKVNDYKNIIDSGKKMCFVWGKEKPILQYENKQHFLFVDSIDNTVSPYIQRKYFEGWYDELFYWTPDYPLLPVKMAHTVKNYIDFTEDDEHFADDPYRKNFFSPKLNKYLNHNFIKLLLYPKWSSIIHDAGKPLSLTYSQRDFWFLSGTSDERNKFIDITNNYFDKFQSRKESRRCVMPIYSDKYYLE